MYAVCFVSLDITVQKIDSKPSLYFQIHWNWFSLEDQIWGLKVPIVLKSILEHILRIREKVPTTLKLTRPTKLDAGPFVSGFRDCCDNKITGI